MAALTVYGGPVFEESVSAVTAAPSVDEGSRRTHKGEDYLYCYNAGGASVMAGYGVHPMTGASGFSVAGTGVSDTEIPCVGVIKHVTMLAGSWAWVMVKGFMEVHTANSAVSDGAMPLGAAVGVTDKGLAFGDITGTGTNPACGFKQVATATGSGGTIYAFINTGF